MNLGLKMIACLSIVLCTVLIQNVHGTFFPPVNNSPPIPSQAVRNLNSPQQSFNAPQVLPRDFSEARETGFFPSDAIRDEERFYFQENQSEESRGRQSSSDRFEGYYVNNERAIGEVATPIPDDAYAAQSSSISNSNPADYGISSNSGIFFENPERWVEIQIPSERIVGNVNQDSGIPVATDAIKSIVAPPPFDINPNAKFPPNSAINIVQVRPSSGVELQKVYRNVPRTVDNIPTFKQVASVPQPPPFSVKSVVQQEIISDVPPFAIPPPAPAQISSKKSFAVPPPPPPPLKGVDTPNIISSIPINIIPDSNVVVSSKNIIPDSSIVSGKSVAQQVRHVWIPTSDKTGKFITIPISGSVSSTISDINKGFSLDSTPITVSDTWVLKQDGPFPSFEKQKSALAPVSPPIVQSGKVIFQNPTIVQVDGLPNQIVAKVDSPKNPPVIEKSIAPNGPIDIWPARKELTSSKVLGSYSPVFASAVSAAAIKSSAAVIGKSPPELLPTPQKTIVTDTKSSFLPPVPPQPVQVLNGKPCPVPLPSPQKSVYTPLNSGLISIPSIITTQRRLPFARIIRVNRFPTDSYYILNRSIRPSYFGYPNQAIIQQPKTGLINILQNRPIPLPPVKSKQVSIPVQSKQIAYSLPAKQVAYPYISRQVLLPATPPKSTRIIYPTPQALRYAYPWNAYLASNPKFGNGAYSPEFSSFRLTSKGSESESSSSESSSENSSSESSSESSKEKKEEKSKKEKSKKEEKAKSVENSSSSESGKESESESKSKSKERETEDESPEQESKESSETSESQTTE